MFERLCELAGAPEMKEHPDYADAALRSAKRDKPIAALNERFAARGRAERVALLNGNRIPAAPVNNPEQLFSDPHVRLAGLAEEIRHPLIGKLKTMANPLRLAAMPEPSVRRPLRMRARSRPRRGDEKPQRHPSPSDSMRTCTCPAIVCLESMAEPPELKTNEKIVRLGY